MCPATFVVYHLEQGGLENRGREISHSIVGAQHVNPSEHAHGISLNEKSQIISRKQALVVSCILLIFQQFSGINSIFYYSATILNKFGANHLGITEGNTIVSAFGFGACIIPFFALKKYTSRPILVISCGGICICSIILSITDSKFPYSIPTNLIACANTF